MSSIRTFILVLAITPLFTLLETPPPVAGQETSSPRFDLLVGAEFLDADLKLSFFAPGLGTGTEIDYEDHLGLDARVSEARLSFAYRFGETRRHELELAYLRVGRGGVAILSSDIQIGDDIFEAGLSVDSEVVTSDLTFDYNYFLLRRPHGDLAIGVGVHGLEVTARSLARARLGSSQAPEDIILEEEVQTQFPLPVAGMKGSLRPSRKLVLRGGFRWLEVEVGAYSGRLFDGYLRLEHETFRHAGFGIGYTRISLDLRRDPGDETLISSIDYEYIGGEIFLRLRF